MTNEVKDKIKKNGFGGTMFLLVSCAIIIVAVMFLYSFMSEHSKLVAGETLTSGNQSFIYLQGEKWTKRQGALATIEAISNFQKEHSDLCVFPWHYETDSSNSNNEEVFVSHGIWIHHRPKSSGGC